MDFEITHQMEFAFQDPVAFEPMTVRLNPRSDAAQTTREHRLEVLPTPLRTFRNLGPDGNIEEVLWFSGRHRRLSLTSVSRVETCRANPFDFLLDGPRTGQLPFSYDPSLSTVLAPCLALPDQMEEDPDVRAFTERILALSDRQTVPFLTLLAREIRTSLTYSVREEGPPHPPGTTLERGEGSCRDFAALAMASCRSCGLAARYTSGYHDASEDRSEEPSLHGWIEVYLPGAGWRGVDPSEGLMTADRHIAVVSSPLPSLTLPTEGQFRGEGRSTLSTRIVILRPPQIDPDSRTVSSESRTS